MFVKSAYSLINFCYFSFHFDRPILNCTVHTNYEEGEKERDCHNEKKEVFENPY